METAIGVFSTRDRAEEAVKELLEHHVPERSIVYLTRSESEAKTVGKQFGAYAGGVVGGAAGMSAGVVAAALLAVPGIGPVFALGFGAAALLGLVGAGTGSAVGASIASDSAAPMPTSGTGSAEDLAFFHRVLNEGHSLIVVRTESSQTAATSCEILDRLGLGMKKGTAPTSRVTTREMDGPVIADFVGKIALAEGTVLLRDTIHDFLKQGNNRIILNLADVDFIDSAGLGELVRTLASVRSHSGQLKLVNPSENVRKLLRITKLDHVFDIENDEASALMSLRQNSAAQAAG
ncbi:MAG TPA: STAS domain-containing protein [Candidatus Acidoferrum sp.]|nr:STAS domain-containing protein [Candidatus Acidoferrum sp.]